MNAYGLTDRGLQRQLNEDSFYFKTSAVGPYPNLFIVADGMGGHQAGEYASRMAVEILLEEIRMNENHDIALELKDETEIFEKL